MTLLPADVVSYRTTLCHLFFDQLSPYFTILCLIPISPSPNNEFSHGITPDNKLTADPHVENSCIRERDQVNVA